MKNGKVRLLAITPVAHIKGLVEKLDRHFDLLVYSNPLLEDIKNVLPSVQAVYTNPNKSRIRIDTKLFSIARGLRVVVTASTGLGHIDLDEAKKRNIRVLSLTKEFATIEKISSTAELALGLTLAALRHIPQAFADVMMGNWDYEKFIGRQMNALKVGVVGYGRLGRKYARYVEAFGSSVMVCDPAYSAATCPYPLHTMEELIKLADIVSLHIHATPENRELIGERLLDLAKPNLLLVNTSRGEVVDEQAVVKFLRENPTAYYATDVLQDEMGRRWDGPVLKMAESGGNILVTPHIGGMTKEAQEMAYHRIADMLIEHVYEGKGFFSS